MPPRKLLPGWLDVSGKVLISADTVWEKLDFEGWLRKEGSGGVRNARG